MNNSTNLTTKVILTLTFRDAETMEVKREEQTTNAITQPGFMHMFVGQSGFTDVSSNDPGMSRMYVANTKVASGAVTYFAINPSTSSEVAESLSLIHI